MTFLALGVDDKHMFSLGTLSECTCNEACVRL